MIDPLLLLASFLTGLAGAGHCAGMCGGIAGALSHAIPHKEQTAWLTVSFSGGRLCMYALLGGIVGGASAMLAPADMGMAMLVSRVLTGIVLLAIGLYLLRVLQWMQYLETAGAHVWRQIAPLARRFLPVTSVPRALAIGALWGLLPCGLVYGALLYAATSGAAVNGAAAMLAFGIGTLPAVLGLGFAARWLAQHAGTLRAWSGGLMIVYGVWTLFSTLVALPAILDGSCRSPGDVFRIALSLLIHVNEAIGP